MDTRRTFSREFQLAAVKKVVEQGLSFREVAKDLGIDERVTKKADFTPCLCW